MRRLADTSWERLNRVAAIAGRPDLRTESIEEVFTGRHLAEVPVGSADDVRAAVCRAAGAQRQWASRSPAERSRVLLRVHDLILDNREYLLDVVQAETGKARVHALEELLDVAANARYYGRVAQGLLAPKRVPGMLPGLTKAVVHHRPKGVVGVISPWNYPMSLPIADSIAALAAGNAVVLKPDLRAPYSALASAELLYEAGIPRDLLAVIPGTGADVGSAVAEFCDYLMFTGSTETGRVLAQTAGRRLIGYSAELGGKNPMIVTAGADLGKVAEAAVRACFANAGQLCVSIERIYVERVVADDFTRLFVDRVRAMRIGASYSYAEEMGSLASLQQLETVSKHVADAVSKGATVLTGGGELPHIGPLFYEPTVLTGVDDSMDCWAEETFGPVVSIYPVADVDDAIAQANNSRFGLNASVWAGTDREGERIAALLRCGTVNVNEGYGPAWASLAAPMGGMGDSGSGRRHGSEGLLKYTESQTVATQRLLDLGGPSWLPRHQWAALMPVFLRAMKLLPRR